MSSLNPWSAKWRPGVIVLSVLLFFFTVPHTLEDFATGEPGKAGAPVAVLSLVIAALLALQAVGLFWLGKKQRRGLWVHVGLGLFWPLAAGGAQLPTILSAPLYRTGALSVLYVVGLMGVGVLLCVFAIGALRSEGQ